MSNKFISSSVVDISKEKEWASQLGMLDWDSTSIVFTKRSLIEFLKYTGTTVDTNFANVQKLPRYAKFGKISVTDEPPPVVDTAPVVAPVEKQQAPNRKHTDIFATQDDGALAHAPPPPEESFITLPEQPAPAPTEPPEEEAGINFTSEFKPSRRVREQPGGTSSIKNSLWGDESSQEAFKPSRRVRETPGGRDQISGIF